MLRNRSIDGSAAAFDMLWLASNVAPAICGVATTLSNCSKGWSCGGGSDIEYVDTSARNLFGQQRRQQRILLMDHPARRVDEIGRWLNNPGANLAAPNMPQGFRVGDR